MKSNRARKFECACQIFRTLFYRSQQLYTIEMCAAHRMWFFPFEFRPAFRTIIQIMINNMFDDDEFDMEQCQKDAKLFSFENKYELHLTISIDCC